MTNLNKPEEIADQLGALLTKETKDLAKSPADEILLKLSILCNLQAKLYLHLQRLRGRPDNLQDWLSFANMLLDMTRSHVDGFESVTVH
jgi:hypothetical protein